MSAFLIYRIINSTHGIEKFIPLEFCKSEAEARKYSRLFDLQVPSDLKDKTYHRYAGAQILNSKSPPKKISYPSAPAPVPAGEWVGDPNFPAPGQYYEPEIGEAELPVDF